jgi:hypothetical protein
MDEKYLYNRPLIADHLYQNRPVLYYDKQAKSKKAIFINILVSP